VAAVTDEIFEKYLQKAIAETNELGDEIARAAGEGQVPVLGSGHPLADVFLLKHSPQPAEVQEGVAFYGRSGQALLKSLQRLNVDPAGDLRHELLQAGRRRRGPGARLADPGAAHRPAEARGRDGRGRPRVPERDRVPARRQARADPRRAAALHAHDPGALRARHRRVAGRGACEDALLERLQGLGPGGPSCRRTERPPRSRVRRARGRRRRLLRNARVVVQALALGVDRVAQLPRDPGRVRVRLARAAGLGAAAAPTAGRHGRLRRACGRAASDRVPRRLRTSRSSAR
jgi:hypothetical protein